VSDLTPIASKLGTFIRLLASDKKGEVDAALATILKTLKSHGADIHDVASLVEKPTNGKLSEQEMRKIYDAGFQDGFTAAENKNHDSLDFRGIDPDDLDWHEIALWVQKHDDRLSDREREFVDSVAAQTVYREPTEKQSQWLRSIFLKCGARL
jgi:hypothetical protein